MVIGVDCEGISRIKNLSLIQVSIPDNTSGYESKKPF